MRRYLFLISFLISLCLAGEVNSQETEPPLGEAATAEAVPMQLEAAPFAEGAAQACYRSLHAQTPSLTPCEEAFDLTNDPTTRSQVASALAMLYAAQGALARAQEYMDQALMLDPENATVLVNLGNLRIKQQRYAESVEAYSRAQDFGALEHPALYLNRSLALRALGRYGEAKKDYDYFLDLKDRGFTLPNDAVHADEVNSNIGVPVEDRAP